jgi:hypothetical protein
MAVNSLPSGCQTKRKIMRLHGSIGAIEVPILVDSGSVDMFISESLAKQLPCDMLEVPAAQYVTADGSPMKCSQVIHNLTWASQGHIFKSEVGVLPLKCFDMIVRLDWLEDWSPMWVHWGKKIMKFTYQGKRMTLKGVQPDVSKCTAISAGKLKGLLRRRAITHCVQMLPESPEHLDQQDTLVDSAICSISKSVDVPEIKELIQKFDHLFQEPEPTVLPPSRQCDHQISLVPGATLVNVRAYRYSPA